MNPAISFLLRLPLRAVPLSRTLTRTHTPTTTPSYLPVIYNVTHTPPLRIPAAWGLVFLTVNGQCHACVGILF